MIRSFRCHETRRLFETGKSRRFAAISRIALRKLDQPDNVTRLDSLAIPPGNQLEALKGIGLGSSVSGSTSSGEFAFAGLMKG
jgi:proteic killer suppression protein